MGSSGGVTGAGTTNPGVNGFRLTLTSGTPVTTADVTGATTIYLTPHVGSVIALNNGSGAGAINWSYLSSNEVSLALGTLTSGLPYDVFAYSNAGTLTLELLAWTNGTTRATALAVTDGVNLKTGALTRRLVGTIYTTSTTATEDSAAKRFVSNVDNRVPRPMKVVEATDTWTYTTSTWRSANNSTANRLQFLTSVELIPVEAIVTMWKSSDNDNQDTVGIAIDATNTNHAILCYPARRPILSGTQQSTTAHYRGYPGVGFHFAQWTEYANGSGTTTWYGDGGYTATGGLQSGIMGTCFN